MDEFVSSLEVREEKKVVYSERHVIRLKGHSSWLVLRYYMLLRNTRHGHRVNIF